jgi:hypothetical protein
MHSFFSPYFYILTFKVKETIDKSNLFTIKQEGIQNFMMNVYMLSEITEIKVLTGTCFKYIDYIESAINN